MNNTPTLPGTLPGLLQPGCPVIWLDCYGDHVRTENHPGGPCRGWMVARPSAWAHLPHPDFACSLVLHGDDEVSAIPLSRLALDLSRPEGVDRATRWLRERVAAHLGDVTMQPETVERLRLACLAVGEVSGG